MTADDLIADAAAATKRLRGEEEPFGLASNEAICPVCRLAFIEAAGASWGACRDCMTDALDRFAEQHGN